MLLKMQTRFYHLAPEGLHAGTPEDQELVSGMRMSGGQEDGGPGNGGPGGDDNDGTGLVTKTRVKTKKPSLYRVVILNDDYTPMEFVVFILERLFNKSAEEAYKIMLHVHNHGVGQVRDLARRNEHPLRCDLERED